MGVELWARRRLISTAMALGMRAARWEVAWLGFLDRPLLGWGEYAFSYVFARHYDPSLIALGGAGIGMGTVYPTTMSAAVLGMRADRLGSGSAVVNATSRVGGAFGGAIAFALQGAFRRFSCHWIGSATVVCEGNNASSAFAVTPSFNMW